jgi:ribonuclease Z
MLKKIQAVWISHPHADHHLGLLRLLSEQSAIPGCNPLILMAPSSLFRFLEEYEIVDNSIRNRYIKVDCRDMVAPNRLPPEVLTMMNGRLGITGCFAVPVAHCAYSYAVTLDGTPFGRLSYSGDCRPSTQFAEQAIDTDLLIHEATFEDGMEDEAVLKKHCTAGEALEVGKKMRAKAIVLTHFSQRYPKLPQLKQSDDKQHFPIVFAFDFMRITPATLTIAAQLTPALRLLYPEDEANPDGPPIREEEGEITAKSILSVPGLFAQKELL